MLIVIFSCVYKANILNIISLFSRRKRRVQTAETMHYVTQNGERDHESKGVQGIKYYFTVIKFFQKI